MVFVFCNCKSIEKKIQGDWFTLGNELIKTPYQEMYFTDSIIYRCDTIFGLKQPYEYYTKKDSLYLIDPSDGETFILGKVEFYKDGFDCKGDLGLIQFQSLQNDSILLSQLLNNDINEDVYYSGFSKRAERFTN